MNVPKKGPQKNLLCLCVITKNEKSLLTNCIVNMQSVADEIVVFDLAANDRVIELSEQLGARVYHQEWADDFSKVRNFCMERARSKWIIFLYADEIISSDQLAELEILMQNPAAEGYLFELEDKQNALYDYPSPQLLRLIRKRDNYRYRYRSFEYIPDEELYAVYNSGIRITMQKNDCNWRQEERARLLQMDLDEHPKDGYVCYLKGLELISEGKFEEAAAFLEISHEKFCGGYVYSPHMYKCLGLSLINIGRYKDAEEILSEGFWLFPYYTDLLVLRAEMYRKLERNQEAINDLLICIDILKADNACVPLPEIDSVTINEMLMEIEKKRM